MTTIYLSCRGAAARARVEGQITHGMAGIAVIPDCSEEWDDLSKTLKIRCGEVSRVAHLEAGQPVYIPQECLIGGQRLECGLDGWDEAGKLRIPTNWASCGLVKPSVAQCDGVEGAEPVPDTLEKVLLRLKAAEEGAQETGAQLGTMQGSISQNAGEITTAKESIAENTQTIGLVKQDLEHIRNNFEAASGYSIPAENAAAGAVKAATVTAAYNQPNTGSKNAPVSLGTDPGLTMADSEGTQVKLSVGSRLYSMSQIWGGTGNFTNSKGEALNSDIRYWDKGKDLHWFGTYTFTGVERWSVSNHVFNLYVPSVKAELKLPYQASKPICRCSHYPGVSDSGLNSASYGIFVAGNPSTVNTATKGVTIKIKDSDFAAAEELASYLKQQYEAGTPVEVMYRLNAPYEAPIPSYEYGLFSSLRVPENMARFGNDDGNYMELEYWKDFPAKNYTDWTAELVKKSSPAICFAGVTTPEEHGALGDGVTDDSMALQSAIDSADVVIATGKYLISDTLLLTGGKTLVLGALISTADIAVKISGVKNRLLFDSISAIRGNGILIRGERTINNTVNGKTLEATDEYGLKLMADVGEFVTQNTVSIGIISNSGSTGSGIEVYSHRDDTGYGCANENYYNNIRSIGHIGVYLHTESNDRGLYESALNNNMFTNLSVEECDIGIQIQGYCYSNIFRNVRNNEYYTQDETTGYPVLVKLIGMPDKNIIETDRFIRQFMISCDGYSGYSASLGSYFDIVNYIRTEVTNDGGGFVYKLGNHMILCDESNTSDFILAPETVGHLLDQYRVWNVDAGETAASFVPMDYSYGSNIFATKQTGGAVFTLPKYYAKKGFCIHQFKVLCGGEYQAITIKDYTGNILFSIGTADVPENETEYAVTIYDGKTKITASPVQTFTAAG